MNSRDPLRYFEWRARFLWWRAMVGAGLVAAVLLVLNAQHRYGRVVFDDSPFADVWQLCERFEYGWPATAFAVPLTNDCSMLPAISEFGLMFDLSVCSSFVVLTGVVCGGVQRRTFLES